MPLITRRSSTRLAPGWFFGKCGSIAAKASSDNQKRWLILAPKPLLEGKESDLPRRFNPMIEF
jgi:hypothetical protein